MWLLDLDTLARGHPEVDLAKFIARLLYFSKDNKAKLEDAQAAVHRFLEYYQRAGGRVSGERLRFYLLCAMARHSAAVLSGGDPIESVERYWDLADQYASGASSLL